MENFRLGSGRLGGLWWDGWVDEFRIGLFMESAESIKASYDSQRPDAVTSFLLCPRLRSAFDHAQSKR